MITLKKSLVGAVVAGALSLTAVAPAFADAWTGGDIIFGDTTNGTEWYVETDGSISHSYVYVDGQVFDRVICGDGGGFMTDSGAFNYSTDFDLVTATNGDQVATNTGTFLTDEGTLDAAVEYRAYAEGDLLRLTYVLTNNTASAITFTPSTYEDPSDNYSDAATTSSGDLEVGTNDYWYTTFDATNQSVVLSRFWGQPEYMTVADTGGLDISSNESSETVTFGDVTIAAGKSFQWIMFYSLKSYTLDADADVQLANAVAAGETAVAEFGGANPSLLGSARLTVDLDTTIPSNWAFTAAAENKPELAETGSTTSSGLTFALVAMVGGIALVLRRRTAKN